MQPPENKESLICCFKYNSYKPLLEITIKYFSITPIRMISRSNYQDFVSNSMNPFGVISAQQAMICQYELIRLLSVGIFDEPGQDKIFEFLESQTNVINTLADLDPWFKVEFLGEELHTDLFTHDFISINFFSAKKGDKLH